MLNTYIYHQLSPTCVGHTIDELLLFNNSSMVSLSLWRWCDKHRKM